MFQRPGPSPARPADGAPVLTVSQLARSVRDALEHRFPLLWVSGEVSNLTLARSGHVYFSLKDRFAQVRCVMFRNRAQLLDCRIEEGLQVEARVLVSFYEARGDFQLVVEHLRPAGLGALYEAFVRLRDRLEHEGLFDPALKRAPPAFPRAIGVVTSLQAAALRDVLTTLARRNASIAVIVYPAQVQGAYAPDELRRALAAAARRREVDVLLLVRGGGSIEDLWAFNDERLARALRACPIPVVCGVGHETDITIADLAADRRAPTPTAAAELVSPPRAELIAQVASLIERVARCTRRGLHGRMQHVDMLARRLVHPARRLEAQRRVLEQLELRLARASEQAFDDARWHVAHLLERSRAHLPNVTALQERVHDLADRTRRASERRLAAQGARVESLARALSHLGPEAVLARGYAIVRTADGSVVRDATVLAPGDAIALRVARGSAEAQVTRARGDA
jgi:exodeoxyribonuclease VII large subunit